MGHIPDDTRWYVADLVMEITVAGDPRNVVHRNLVLIRADSPEEAHRKALDLGHRSETSYDNPNGRPVRITFKGIADLDAVYEEIEDGAELMYRGFIGVPPEELASWIPPKSQLRAFLPPRRGPSPDYRSKEVLQMVEDMLRRAEELRSTRAATQVEIQTESNEP